MGLDGCNGVQRDGMGISGKADKLSNTFLESPDAVFLQQSCLQGGFCWKMQLGDPS